MEYEAVDFKIWDSWQILWQLAAGLKEYVGIHEDVITCKIKHFAKML